jgi:GNAT superfamily N-acetyltransferase
MSDYRFAWAASDEDFAALRRLNHDIFAAELGQHALSPDGSLVDRFESESRFLLAWRGPNLAGMVALRGKAPFSIEQKLADPRVLDSYPGSKLEVRLLAVHPEERNTMVLAGLLGRVLEVARTENWNWLLISGLRERLALYERLGFNAIGPAVQSGQAWYVPMVLDVNAVPATIVADYEAWLRRSNRSKAAPASTNVPGSGTPASGKTSAGNPAQESG